MKSLLAHVMAAAFLGALSFTAGAADTPSDQTKHNAKAEEHAAEAQAKADYKAAKEHCHSLSGNERDVCMKDAKAKYKSAKADAKAHEKSAEAQADAREDKNEARYDAAKERCDALSGSAKDDCIANAKAKYHQ